MQKSVEGVITIVQEGRFQMTDRSGVSQLFVLSPYAAMESDQLVPLGRNQIPVRVTYRDGDNAIARVAKRIDVLEGVRSPGATN